MLNFSIKTNGDAVRLIFTGKVDNEGSVIFQQALDKIVEKNVLNVIFDFKGVELINSSSVGKLLNFYKKLINSGRNFCIDGISEEMLALFKAIGFDKCINIKV